jgi:glutamyl-Q tRNA(Asp) synthetase
VQSQHFAEYRAAIERLDQLGLLYPCFCSRTDIAGAPHGPDDIPLYPGTCRALSAAERADRIATGAPHSLRLDMAAANRTGLWFHERGTGRIDCHPERFGDVVLARKDTPASYHLCVTHDDARQGVTLVTRGTDLFEVTDLHVLLQALFGWPTPEYAHHKLIVGPDGKRLAKRDRALTIRAMRDAGLTPHEVRMQAGFF